MKRLYNRHMGNWHNRAITITFNSFVINAFVGAFNLVLGIYLSSIWFIANAAYYLLLGTARGHLLRKYISSKKIVDANARYNFELLSYRRSGFFVCFLGIVYFCLGLYMYKKGDVTIYKGYIVYLVALVAFLKLSFAIQGMVVARRMKNPVLGAIKIINFIDAMVSIVVTQCTLMSMEKASDAVKQSAILAMGFSAIFFGIGLYMALKKQKELSLV